MKWNGFIRWKYKKKNKKQRLGRSLDLSQLLKRYRVIKRGCVLETNSAGRSKLWEENEIQ